MCLNDFYFARCHKTFKYFEDFDNGNIYLNSTSHFWKLENTFQQDKEGEIFSQMGRGYFVTVKSIDFKNIIKNASNFQDVENVIKDDKVCNIIGETSDFSMKIEGYLCCFYLLPKKDVKFISSSGIEFSNMQSKDDFENYITKYIKETKQHEIYLSIYDAEAFCRVFCYVMEQRGYSIRYNKVTYKDLPYLQKIELYKSGNFDDLIFTKPIKYKYQKEYRLFISPPNDNFKDHIIENNIDISNTIIAHYNCTT